jgi:opacity protein-like surface antigen
MRNLIFVVVSFVALIWAGVAAAVVGATVVATDGAKPLDEATVSLTFKDAGGKKISTISHTTTHAGRKTFKIPDKTAKVDVTVTARNGKRETRTDVDVGTLTGGEFVVDVPGGSEPPSGPGSRSSRPRFTPMPSGPYLTGGPSPYLAFEGLCNFGRFGITERPIGSDIVTFQSTDSGTGCGGGITLGTGNLMPAGPGFPFAMSPFVSADFLGQDIAHGFVGGSSIAERINFVGTLGLQAALYDRDILQLYVLAGIAVVEKQFAINFVGSGNATNDQWLWGGTLGGGIALAPPSFQIYDRQVTLFGQYQHIWVQDATWMSPSSSRFFIYTFRNDMDIVKFGARIPLFSRMGP